MNHTEEDFLKNRSGFIKLSELAVLYFPGSRPDVASRKLRKRIKETKSLYEELLEADYDEKNIELTPAQTNIIRNALGTPEAFKRKYSQDL